MSQQPQHPNRFRSMGYWFNLIAQPILAVAFIVGLAWLFGYLQRNHNWFNDARTSDSSQQVEDHAQYACSMLCVFVKAPGRCPVCGMELQKIEAQGDPKDIYGVTITPAARRLANIETVAALNLPTSRKIEAFGQITYDESKEASVAAYVSGRIEKLFVEFTGATIQKGDDLAVIYSPDLYADQVGLLQAKAAVDSNSQNERVLRTNKRLYQSARQRLIEQGIPEERIDTIEAKGTPDSNIKVIAPITGTVVKKLVDDGSYVQTGTPILKIVDLTTVWMLLDLYPEDSANLKVGQTASIQIHSLQGKTFEGKIAFVDPIIDEQKQTAKVRVEIPNESRLIKIGDLGSARIQLGTEQSSQSLVVVPREAILRNGKDSVAYVETEPGRFEFRAVEIESVLDDKIAISKGLQAGEQVVRNGTFMLDSTFNIQGKVSLIDPRRAPTKDEAMMAKNQAEAREIEAAFASLNQDDRRLATSQVICPVTEVKLGTLGMGAPLRIKLDSGDVMICCKSCESMLKREPEKYLAILNRFHQEATQSMPPTNPPEL